MFSSTKPLTEGCAVTGGEFCKFYQRPLETYFDPGDIIEAESRNNFVIYDFSDDVNEDCSSKFSSVSTQTDFRESEVQTEPWDPPYLNISGEKDPEILTLKDLTFGSGLPVTGLEVNRVLESRENKILKCQLSASKNEDAFEKKKQLIADEIKSDWKYKLSVLKGKQLKKLEKMEEAVADEIRRYSNKKDQLLQNLWTNKKEQLKKQNLNLKAKLQKDLRLLETTYLNKKYGDPSEKGDQLEQDVSAKPVMQKEFPAGTDYMLSNYYLSNPRGLLTIKDWLETKADGLKTEIPLPTVVKKTQREKLAESAYKSILESRRTKLPPVVYREDYEPEESPAVPTVKAEDVMELFEFEEEQRVDMVTVWQKVLRGRAMQKQMLELIEQHKDGLSKVLSPLYPELFSSGN